MCAPPPASLRRRVGRVRYGFAFRRPLDNLVRDYRLQARSKRPSEPDARDPATQVRSSTLPLLPCLPHGAHTAQHPGLACWC